LPRRPPRSPPFPYTTLFRSRIRRVRDHRARRRAPEVALPLRPAWSLRPSSISRASRDGPSRATPPCSPEATDRPRRAANPRPSSWVHRSALALPDGLGLFLDKTHRRLLARTHRDGE